MVYRKVLFVFLPLDRWYSNFIFVGTYEAGDHGAFDVWRNGKNSFQKHVFNPCNQRVRFRG